MPASCKYLFMVFPVALPEELGHGRVSLRALQDEDWQVEYDLSRIPDVQQWTYYPPDLDEASARRRIGRTRERHQQRVAGRYAVVVDGAVVGTAGMALVEGPEPQVFYVLKPSGRGYGVATEAVHLLTDWLFAQGFPSVALDTLSGNTASERVAGRTGFRSTGSSFGTQRGQSVQLNHWRRDAD